ncbi:hypothetical protein V3C33_13440 [Micrococcaceae bacterium Sec5.7]
MATAILLAIIGGELLLQRNYGTVDAHSDWPRQALSPALLTAAIMAILLLAVVLIVTAVGESGPGQEPGWIPTTVASAVVGLVSVPALLIARLRSGIESTISGLDGALQAITMYRIVRTLAAFFTAQAGVLLSTASRAWPPVLGIPENPGPQSWQPAVTAGTLIIAVAVVIAGIPVRNLTGKPARPAARSEAEPAR